MGLFTPKVPQNPTPDSPSGTQSASSNRCGGGWRSKSSSRSSSGSATRVTVGDGQTVSVVNAGGHRTGGWRDRQAQASSSVKAGKGSRVTERTSDGDIKNIRS